MAGRLSGLFSFLDFSALRANLALFLIGAISWLIPLAAIVPPATLTVSLYRSETAEVRNMSGIDFVTGPLSVVDYVSAVNGSRDVGDFGAFPSPEYVGSSPQLSRLALATALQGELPAIIPQAPAESLARYTLDFNGPRLRCSKASIDILRSFDQEDCPSLEPSDDCDTRYSYLSWTPTAQKVVPFSEDDLADGALPISESAAYDRPSYLGAYREEQATVYVAVDFDYPSKNWTLLSCALGNTTYTVDFDFSDRSKRQNIEVVQTHDRNPVGVDWLKGGTYGGRYDLTVDFRTLGPVRSYQSLMECLGRVLVGSMSFSKPSILKRQGNVMYTELAYTKEMFPLFNRTITAQNSKSTSNHTLEAMRSRHFGRPLGEVVEELFENTTLSLFSSEQFLGSRDMASNVTMQVVGNLYVYSPRELVLAYGLGIGFSLVAVLAGFWSILDNQAAYSYRFSTVLRATRDCGAGMSVGPVGDGPDGLGDGKRAVAADPLPEELGREMVRIGVAQRAAPFTNSTCTVSGEPGLSAKSVNQRSEGLSSGVSDIVAQGLYRYM